jgi:hypothetical protein
LSGDTLNIYNKIIPIIDDIIGDRKLTADMFRPIIIKLIGLIDSHISTTLDGSHKKQLALNVLDYIIKDLKNKGKVDQIVADALLISLELFGSSLIDFGVAFVRKVASAVEKIEEDIEKNGCSGCCSRNFFKKNNKK